MVEDTWQNTALPILEYIHNNGGTLGILRVSDISEALGIDPLVVAEEIERLADAKYLTVNLKKLLTGGNPGPWYLYPATLAEKGLRVVGAWPAEGSYDALLQLLDRKIDGESDKSARTRLKKLRHAVTEVGKTTIAGLIVEMAKGGIRF
jgi:hypothetical protein